MPTKNCYFCNVEFNSSEGDELVTCDICAGIICRIVNRSKKVRKKIIKSLITDNDFIKEIGKKLFETPIVDIGLGGPGTLAQWFCEKRKKKVKKGTS